MVARPFWFYHGGTVFVAYSVMVCHAGVMSRAWGRTTRPGRVEDVVCAYFAQVEIEVLVSMFLAFRVVQLVAGCVATLEFELVAEVVGLVVNTSCAPR